MKINELLKLSLSNRIILAPQLQDSVFTKDVPLSDPIKQELDMRLEAHEKGEMKYFTL
jgi:putative addiction module component (TIGR02574 family)